MRTIEWKDGLIETIDQTKLPKRTTVLRMRDPDEVAQAIRSMQIRGAPLLGAAAAYALALVAQHSNARDKNQLIDELIEAATSLEKTRPTAKNLFWALDRVLDKARRTAGDIVVIRAAVIDEAKRIADEDVAFNLKIGKYGSSLINDGDTVLTHCNAGSLATVEYGTALGVIRAAVDKGIKLKVIATETRPLLQGARLTAYELTRDGIPVRLITDSMVGYAMYRGLVDKVIVGADRIVEDAVINKIGTFTIAVLAHEYGIPFYVAAPTSTFDLKQKAENIIIEKRSAEEVTTFAGTQIAPKGVSALNPAFDITPFKYVTRLICEEGVFTAKAVLKFKTQ